MRLILSPSGIYHQRVAHHRSAARFSVRPPETFRILLIPVMGGRVVKICFPSSIRFVGLLLLTIILGARAGGAEREDFLVQVWDTDSGLPHSTVTSIAQTPDGYLWAGTLLGRPWVFPVCRSARLDLVSNSWRPARSGSQ